MKISLTFSGKKAENYKFTEDKELLIYFTDIFRIGIGFKYRSVDPKEQILLCTDYETGKREETLGHVVTLRTLRIKYWNIATLPWAYHEHTTNISSKYLNKNKTTTEGING